MTDAERLNRLDRFNLVALLIAAVVFGWLTEVRAAHLYRRMGDAGVYFRAAWAARQGGERLYTITDDNGWHYHYPPLLAILLRPLADPPRGETAGRGLPYEVAVAVWYAFGLACLAWALNALASALDPSAPRFGRSWWSLRLLPMLAVLPCVGETLHRGQINLLMLAALCGWLASSIRGRPFRAGVYLAGAICVKIIPAFLLLVPLVRRERRCLLGCAAGLFVGLLVIPAAALGPRQTADCYAGLWRGVLAPGLGHETDAARNRELINVTATDSQSFLAVIHNALHLERKERPAVASPKVRLAHFLLGGAMTVLTLLAFRRPPARARAVHLVLFAGALTLTMLMLSPVCHLHYFVLGIPPIMALVAMTRGRSVFPTAWVIALMGLVVVCNALPHFPGLEVTRDVGLAAFGGLALWLTACLVGRRLSAREQARSAKSDSEEFAFATNAL